MTARYRNTVGLPGLPRYSVSEWDDSPRTAILVAQGVLQPADPPMTDPLPVPSADLAAAAALGLDSPPSTPTDAAAALAALGDPAPVVAEEPDPLDAIGHTGPDGLFVLDGDEPPADGPEEHSGDESA